MDRISQLLDKLSEFGFYSDDLDFPVSVTEDGKIATTRDLIISNASEKTRTAFRKVFGEIMDANAGRVIPVENLDASALRQVAIEVLQKANPDKKFGIIPGGTFTKDQLIEEVRQETRIGVRFAEAIREGSLFTQQVIETNRAKPIAGPRPDLEFPKFDF